MQDGIILDIISSMDLERPRPTPVLPECDLGVVLEASLRASPRGPTKALHLQVSLSPSHDLCGKM